MSKDGKNTGNCTAMPENIATGNTEAIYKQKS